jgi:SAM-dependent methyltransferase
MVSDYMSIREYHFSENESSMVCPVCLGSETAPVLAINQVPVHCNLLWESRETAVRTPRGDIHLGLCQVCGHLYNQAFDPESIAYSQAYENALDFSAVFQEYLKSLADGLIERHSLNGKHILEIGCGQGDFLKLLCKLGDNHGIGFDPGYRPSGAVDNLKGKVQFIQDFYGDKYLHITADFFCARHVLEHLRFPRSLLDTVKQSIAGRSDAVLFLEVPNALYTLRDRGIWDLIYEHFSYFNAQSLAYLVESRGFEICRLEETFHGQYLIIEAQLGVGEGRNNQVEKRVLSNLVSQFAHEYQNKIEYWRESLASLVQSDQKVVAWGSGSKGVTFLNVVATLKEIPYIVDINPRKHGCYVAGGGQRIVSPDFLLSYRPDVIILMNPVYENEIRDTVKNMGLQPDFLIA